MKRYVLLEDKTIYDTSKYIEDEDWGTCAIEVTGKYLTYYLLPNHTLIQKLGIIKLQSDNLLDLLEVGDCVEDEEISQVINIFKTDNGYKIIITNTKTFETKLGCPTIKAIWKRNGDVMRRYER
jgi:hypothetical protein